MGIKSYVVLTLQGLITPRNNTCKHLKCIEKTIRSAISYSPDASKWHRNPLRQMPTTQISISLTPLDRFPILGRIRRHPAKSYHLTSSGITQAAHGQKRGTETFSKTYA